MNRFYSNGKLLLTGEYTVLDGAIALALPTVFGQELLVQENNSETISWKSYDWDKSVWIDVVFSFSEIIKNNFVSDNSFEQKLSEILFQAYLLNPKFLEKNKGYQVETQLTFPRLWGLGTSSTLINNLAKWLKINPYELLKNTFSGSGYDIACAENHTPILFRLEENNPVIEPIHFKPEFSDNLFFVYLNKKQNSRSAIASYYNKQFRISKTIKEINRITTGIQQTKSLSEFTHLLEKHEAIMSNVLEMQTIKETFFADFKGTVKSLGAWGGDFVLVVSKENPANYFKQKGFEVVIPYKEMIL